MASEIPNDIDRAAIEEHAQRTVERTALRKVRKTLDEIQDAETARRRTLQRTLIACAILLLLGAWGLWEIMFSGRDFAKGPPIEIPSTLPKNK